MSLRRFVALSPIVGAITVGAACGFDGVGGRAAPEATTDASDASDASSASDTSSAVDAVVPEAASATGALSFDGVDDFVNVVRQIDADFTLEAWIRTTTSRAGMGFYDGLGVIFADVPGSANDFGTSIVGDKFVFGTVDLTIASTTTVTTGAWVHVAAVRIRDSGTMRVLVNGMQEAQTTAGSTELLTAPSAIVLGGNVIDKRFFKGTMDEVRIWNVARTGAEILGAMKTRLVGNEAGLVGYWRFDDATGGVALDSSPSKNDGMLGAGASAAQPSWVSPGAF